jgi:ferredoxin
MRIAVIGSGPSGWAVIEKLNELGHQVHLIDTGLEEDSIRSKDKKVLSRHLKEKLYFGSDLPYREYPVGPKTTLENVNPLFSYAKGGLSLVWGATMLPFSSLDTKHWPFQIDLLNKYYDEIARKIPIMGANDDLTDIYGEYLSRRTIFQSQRMLKLLENFSRIESNQFTSGISRLAVETSHSATNSCIYCNQCLTGCPRSSIWSSRKHTLAAHVVNCRVVKIKEVANRVYVYGLDINGVEMEALCFDKVYLASGPIESFRILSQSGIVNKKAELKDSATFLIPLLASPMLGSPKSNSFALSQCFIRLSAENGNVFQFQLYEYSPDLLLKTRESIPFGRFLPIWFLKFLLQRLVVAIGYLGAEHSPSIQMNLINDGSLHLGISEFGSTQAETKRIIKNAIRLLSKFTRPAGLFPLSFLSKLTSPGEGVHFGSWLPIGQASDSLGRPQGVSNIHVVDSSVLPSIPAGPITFTIMANAMRIAEESSI